MGVHWGRGIRGESDRVCRQAPCLSIARGESRWPARAGSGRVDAGALTRVAGQGSARASTESRAVALPVRSCRRARLTRIEGSSGCRRAAVSRAFRARSHSCMRASTTPRSWYSSPSPGAIARARSKVSRAATRSPAMLSRRPSARRRSALNGCGRVPARSHARCRPRPPVPDDRTLRPAPTGCRRTVADALPADEAIDAAATGLPGGEQRSSEQQRHGRIVRDLPSAPRVSSVTAESARSYTSSWISPSVAQRATEGGMARSSSRAASGRSSSTRARATRIRSGPRSGASDNASRPRSSAAPGSPRRRWRVASSCSTCT